MKRVLILGGEGMLGHKACQVFSEHYDTYVTFRSYDELYQGLNFYSNAQAVDGVDAFEMDNLAKVIHETRPEIVLNCIGIIKQREKTENPRRSIYLNALFPHLVAEACQEVDAKLIQVSTDCVFSGEKGDYTEEDQPD
ncbi:MAG: sugar nucleotide-binding protein, partial [Fidelibacterota bacterium]